MRRALPCFVAVVALATCRPWDATYDEVVGRNDAGAGAVDSGSPDAGTADAGADAGPPPCTAPACLVEQLDAGYVFRAVASAAPGEFVAVGATDVVGLRPAQRALTSGGAFAVDTFPALWALNTPTSVTRPTATTYAVVDPSVVQLVDGTDHPRTVDCGFASAERPYWQAVSAASADEVWAVGDAKSTCRWRRDAGFEGYTLDGGNTAKLYAVKAFPGGAVAAVGAGGQVVRWSAGADPRFETLSGVDDLYAVDGPSPDELFVAGRGLALARFHDGGWTVDSAGAASNQWYFALAVKSSADVWAVGGITSAPGGPAPLVQHWNGGAWADVTLPGVLPTDVLYGVAADDAGTLVVGGKRKVADTSNGVLLRYQLR